MGRGRASTFIGPRGRSVGRCLPLVVAETETKGRAPGTYLFTEQKDCTHCNCSVWFRVWLVACFILMTGQLQLPQTSAWGTKRQRISLVQVRVMSWGPDLGSEHAHWPPQSSSSFGCFHFLVVDFGLTGGCWICGARKRRFEADGNQRLREGKERSDDVLCFDSSSNLPVNRRQKEIRKTSCVSRS